MRRGVKKHSIFGNPGSAFIKLITFFCDTQTDDIAMIQTPVIVIDILSVGNDKTAGTEGHSANSNSLLIGSYFILRVDLNKPNLNLSLKSQYFHFKVTVFG